MDPLTKAKILRSQIRHVGNKGIEELGININPFSSSNVGEIPEKEFEQLLRRFEDDTVFVHVGLSDINSAFDGDPYTFILDRLENNFQNIMGTGYTPTFRKSGIYHKKYSTPAYGTFSKLFLQDAEYRTNDAIHSILVKGDYRFEGYNHQNSFGENSCRKKLDEDNTLCLNIGTDRFVCLVLHYLEGICDLPYVEKPEYEGVIYYDESKHEKVNQKNYSYNKILTWNNKKIKKKLIKEDVLEDLTVNNLNIYAYKFHDVKETLKPILDDNPYYLVT